MQWDYLCLSGKMPVLNELFNIIVIGFMRTCEAAFNIFVDKLSYPQLDLFVRVLMKCLI